MVLVMLWYDLYVNAKLRAPETQYEINKGHFMKNVLLPSAFTRLVMLRT